MDIFSSCKYLCVSENIAMKIQTRDENEETLMFLVIAKVFPCIIRFHGKTLSPRFADQSSTCIVNDMTELRDKW